MRRSAWVSVIILVGLHPGNRDGAISGLTVYHARDQNGPFTAVSDFYINAGFADAGVTELGFFFVGVLKSPAELSCP
jgi:hypothetical protein